MRHTKMTFLQVFIWVYIHVIWMGPIVIIVTGREVRPKISLLAVNHQNGVKSLEKMTCTTAKTPPSFKTSGSLARHCVAVVGPIPSDRKTPARLGRIFVVWSRVIAWNKTRMLHGKNPGWWRWSRLFVAEKSMNKNPRSWTCWCWDWRGPRKLQGHHSTLVNKSSNATNSDYKVNIGWWMVLDGDVFFWWCQCITRDSEIFWS